MVELIQMELHTEFSFKIGLGLGYFIYPVTLGFFFAFFLSPWNDATMKTLHNELSRRSQKQHLSTSLKSPSSWKDA